jgi:hypothetical protein
MAGAPSKYSPELDKKAYKLALLGATDKQLSDFFEIAESTLNEWKKKYPSFTESLKRGKIEVDAKVAQSLFKRACGYKHKEDKIFLYEGQAVVVPTTKHYAPDTLACIYWLNNRQPEQWRNKVEGQEDENWTPPKPETVEYKPLKVNAG